MTQAELKNMSINELLLRFIELGLAQDEALLDDNYAKYGRLYRQMSQIDDELRARGPEARLALTRLFDHPNLQVRLRAAARTLGVAPVEARKAIEAVANSGHFPQAGDAGMLLAGLDDGTFKPT